MNIIEAVKSCRKFRRANWPKRSYYHVINGNIIDDEGNIGMGNVDNLLSDDYELYTPEIRPKEAGELWECNNVYGVTYEESDNIMFYETECNSSIPIAQANRVIHGQNGWKRLHPKVEDCERVEIEDVCPLCEHEWSRHDPEDGMCDAGPYCKCGRDLDWMQQRIAEKSKENL